MRPVSYNSQGRRTRDQLGPCFEHPIVGGAPSTEGRFTSPTGSRPSSATVGLTNNTRGRPPSNPDRRDCDALCTVLVRHAWDAAPTGSHRKVRQLCRIVRGVKMSDQGDAGVVRSYLTALDERRFEDALGLLGEGWVEHGSGQWALDREAFLAASEAMLGGNDLRVTIHGQVANNGRVATHLTWADDSQQADVLRLDVVRNGRVSGSRFHTAADMGERVPLCSLVASPAGRAVARGRVRTLRPLRGGRRVAGSRSGC